MRGAHDASDRPRPIAARRSFLAATGTALLGALPGCAAVLGDGSRDRPVDILLQNDDTSAWRVLVAVADATGSAVFRSAETVPADTGEDLGEVLLEDAFTGRPGDRFTIEARLDGEPAGTFDYEITCPDDNRFSLLVEHTPYEPADGEPIDYVADRCGE